MDANDRRLAMFEILMRLLLGLGSGVVDAADYTIWRDLLP